MCAIHDLILLGKNKRKVCRNCQGFPPVVHPQRSFICSLYSLYIHQLPVLFLLVQRQCQIIATTTTATRTTNTADTARSASHKTETPILLPHQYGNFSTNARDNPGQEPPSFILPTYPCRPLLVPFREIVAHVDTAAISCCTRPCKVGTAAPASFQQLNCKYMSGLGFEVRSCWLPQTG